MSKIITLDEWIERFEKVHGQKYDYSKVETPKSHTKVCIICPEHGEFWQTPNNHIMGYGCPKCGLEKVKRIQKEKNIRCKNEFTNKAKITHNDKYDYSKVEYVNAKTKVCIICPEHGEFWQTPGHHLFGNGCPKCSKNNKMNVCEFVRKAKDIYGSKYDYSKVEYINSKTPICIICPEHGEFWQRPNDHLTGHGCYKCNCHNHTKDFENFKLEAEKIHNGKYKYVRDTYNNRGTKTKIICPEHGEFWQKAIYHLQGNGCPLCGNKCNISEQKVLNEIKKAFKDEEIIYQYRNHKLLGNLSFDIFFPKFKIAIEHQGIQHYEPISRFGGKCKLEETKIRDEIKRNICTENGILLLYVSLDKNVIKYSTKENEIIPNTDTLIKKISNKLNKANGREIRTY